MKPVHILGRALWTPSFPSLDAFRAGIPDADSTRPAVDFVTSRNKRGCSILTLAAAEVAHQAALDAGVPASEPALIFGSCHGEMEIAVAQMEMFQDGSGLLSPQRFKNSVHNTGAGMFSIAMDNRGYATAIAGGHDTVALCLLEAMLLLRHDRYETAIVALADELLPEPLRSFSPHAALGVAIVLGRDASSAPRSLGTLSMPERVEPSAAAYADPDSFGGNPMAPLLEVINAADGVHPDASSTELSSESRTETRVALSLPGGQPWIARVQTAPRG